MRQVLLLIIFILFIILFGCTYYLSKESNKVIEKYNKTGMEEIITEEPGGVPAKADKLSEDLKKILNSTNKETLHVSVQLEMGFNESKLKETGIIIHGYMGNSFWSATIHVKNITKITNLTDIKEIMEIPAERKLIDVVKNATYHDYAKHPDGDVSVIVSFFPDVNNQSASDILAKYSAEREWMGSRLKYGPGPFDNYYRVKISPNNIRKLAEDDEVKFIAEIEGPSGLP